MTVDLTGGLSEELEHVFTAQPEHPEMHESVNAWIWDEGAAFGLPRIGIEAVADQWDTHDAQVNVAFADGRVYQLFAPGPIHDPSAADTPRVLGAGPLSFEVVEPYGLLRMRLQGEARASSVEAQIGGALPGQGDPVPIEIEVDLRPAVPPWMNGTLREDAKRVLDTQEEGDLMGHPWRFEQLCRPRDGCGSATRPTRSTVAPTGSADRASAVRPSSGARLAGLPAAERSCLRVHRLPAARRRPGHLQRGLRVRGRR